MKRLHVSHLHPSNISKVSHAVAMRLTTLSLTLASCVSMVSADCNFGLVNQAKGARSNINNICSKAGPIQEKFIYDCRDGKSVPLLYIFLIAS